MNIRLFITVTALIYCISISVLVPASLLPKPVLIANILLLFAIEVKICWNPLLVMSLRPRVRFKLLIVLFRFKA